MSIANIDRVKIVGQTLISAGGNVTQLRFIIAQGLLSYGVKPRDMMTEAANVINAAIENDDRNRDGR